MEPQQNQAQAQTRPDPHRILVAQPVPIVMWRRDRAMVQHLKDTLLFGKVEQIAATRNRVPDKLLKESIHFSKIIESPTEEEPDRLIEWPCKEEEADYANIIQAWSTRPREAGGTNPEGKPVVP